MNETNNNFASLIFANYVAIIHSSGNVFKEYLVGFVYIITRTTDKRNYATDQTQIYFRFQY